MLDWLLKVVQGMRSEDWVAFLAVLVSVLSLTVTVMSMIFARRRERELRDREDALRAEMRALVPRLEYDLEAHFHRLQGAHWATELRIIVNNKGSVRREFKSIIIRLRIVSQDVALEDWTDRPGRLYFPEKILDIDFVPESADGKHYYFVEPGVRQIFSYTTRVPATAILLHVHVSFLSRLNDSRRELPFEDLFVEERTFSVPIDNAAGTSAATAASLPGSGA